MKKFSNLLFFSLCLLFVQVISASDLLGDDEESNIKVSGNGYLLSGQIVKGHAYGRSNAHPIDMLWHNIYGGRINITSEPNDWFRAKVGLEITSAFPLSREGTIMKNIFKTQTKTLLPVASGLFNLDMGNYLLRFEAGVMEYAFNEEVKNLGNYMYRTTAYPMDIRTKLDYIYSNLSGVRAEVGLLDENLKVGTILNTITDAPPFFDWNLGFYASYATENKMLDVGAGMVLERVFSIDDTATDILGDTYFEELGATFRGTKLHGRVTFDPKPLFGAEDGQGIFGKSDLKIYLEAAIVGLKDYDWYNSAELDPEHEIYPKPDLMNRVPILFGINVPTFKVLDHLSLEFEHCKYPYPFEWWGQLANPSPKPFIPEEFSDSDAEWREIYKTHDNWKWSVHLKKSISKFDIIAMFANDHILYESFNAETHFYPEKSLRGKGNWHWYLKFQANL